MSTLSVETSSSGSSTSTSSPTDFSQRVTVPSVTDSPSAGRVTSEASPPADGAPSEPWSVEARSSGAGSPAGSCWASSCCASSTAGSSAAASSSDASAEPPPEPSPIVASGAPTSTVSSSSTRISSSTPATGDGISVSTLSVETSTRGSSTATSSPTALSQRVTVPSVTDSPRAGRFTVSDMVPMLLMRGGRRGRPPGVARWARRTDPGWSVRWVSCAAGGRTGPWRPRPGPRSAWGARARTGRRPRGRPPSSR